MTNRIDPGYNYSDMITIIRFLHLLSLVVWIGGMIFFSFMAAPSIFKILSRDKAGDVVGDIFPKYWLMGYLCSVIALLSILILSFQVKSYPIVKISLLVLLCGLTFYSGLAVGTKARKVKARIRTIEDPTQKEILKAQFASLHRRSTILNSIILILGIITIFLAAVVE